jgi:hypothetical protein
MTLISCVCGNAACEAAPHMGRPRCSSSVIVDAATSADVTTQDSGAIYGPLGRWDIDAGGKTGRCEWCVIANS